MMAGGGCTTLIRRRLPRVPRNGVLRRPYEEGATPYVTCVD